VGKIKPFTGLPGSCAPPVRAHKDPNNQAEYSSDRILIRSPLSGRYLILDSVKTERR